MKVLVTGGAGFIGSAVVRRLIGSGCAVVNLDALTYAGDLASVASVAGSSHYAFEQADICDAEAVASVFERYNPDAVIHLAAETHVDRSIDDPSAFIRTNVVGTGILLSAALRYWERLLGGGRDAFRLLHVSTDEVYGDVGPDGDAAIEGCAYAPGSPYAASKAAADHMVRAWGHTYGLPTLITHGANTYGPWQFPEKLIPLTILNAVEGKPIGVYGAGEQVRDWLYVEDHAEALVRVLGHGVAGQTYNLGSGTGRRNVDVVREVCAVLEALRPGGGYEELITFVADRPGHDCRYAMDISKIGRDIGWVPGTGLAAGLRLTAEWSLANLPVLLGRRASYDGRRLGLRGAGV